MRRASSQRGPPRVHPAVRSYSYFGSSLKPKLHVRPTGRPSQVFCTKHLTRSSQGRAAQAASQASHARAAAGCTSSKQLPSNDAAAAELPSQPHGARDCIPPHTADDPVGQDAPQQAHGAPGAAQEHQPPLTMDGGHTFLDCTQPRHRHTSGSCLQQGEAAPASQQ